MQLNIRKLTYKPLDLDDFALEFLWFLSFSLGDILTLVGITPKSSRSCMPE